MRVKFFAKEKPGVKEALHFLYNKTKDIEVYIGKVGDKFPEEAKENVCDIVISYISPWIIPSSVLKSAKYYSINFHPGPPEYPGIGCTNFALYEEAKEFGVTCHLMEEKVDSGQIINVKRFPIYKTDSVLTLAERAYAYIIIQFYEVMNDFFENKKLVPNGEKWQRKPFTRKQLNNLCKISLDMTEEEIKKRIRATTYPNMPGPYIDILGYKFEYKTGNEYK